MPYLIDRNKAYLLCDIVAITQAQGKKGFCEIVNSQDEYTLTKSRFVMLERYANESLELRLRDLNRSVE